MCFVSGSAFGCSWRRRGTQRCAKANLRAIWLLASWILRYFLRYMSTVANFVLPCLKLAPLSTEKAAAKRTRKRHLKEMPTGVRTVLTPHPRQHSA